MIKTFIHSFIHLIGIGFKVSSDGGAVVSSVENQLTIYTHKSTCKITLWSSCRVLVQSHRTIARHAPCSDVAQFVPVSVPQVQRRNQFQFKYNIDVTVYGRQFTRNIQLNLAEPTSAGQLRLLEILTSLLLICSISCRKLLSALQSLIISVERVN